MFFKKKYDSINATQLNDMLTNNINLIDVREVSEYQAIHIKGAKNVPLMGLLNNPTQFLNKEETYYIVCQSGARSGRACGMLKDQGYNVMNVDGGTGIFAYMHQGSIA
ncbi:MAG: rhodanese-like domain-containing protein [Clostridiales bacterium]|nr:rhodanese-like domain-containing protein [Clostridiales bacterium]